MCVCVDAKKWKLKREKEIPCNDTINRLEIYDDVEERNDFVYGFNCKPILLI